MAPLVSSLADRLRRALTPAAAAAGLACALLLSACASTVGPPMKPDNRTELPACGAYAAGVVPGGPRAYLVPRPTQTNGLSRCSVETLALATHELGQFRKIYGGDTSAILPSEAINPVIGDLAAKAPVFCRREGGRCVFRILIFAHGGMVGQAQAIGDAEALAPAMISDGYAPLFLIWNSDIETAYVDRLCCVLDGEQDHNVGHMVYFAPVRAAGDLSASATRALENFGQQAIRYNDSVLERRGTQYFLKPFDNAQICQLLDHRACPKIIYPFETSPFDPGRLNALDQVIPERTIEYAAGFPFRVGTTVIGPEVGAKAWDNMVRRTRLPLEDTLVTISTSAWSHEAPDLRPGAPPSPPFDCQRLTDAADAAFHHQHPEGARRIRSLFEPEGEGAFLLFFDRLACEINHRHFKDRDGNPVKVEIYYFGHSMGALVGNEILLRHPELPWRRIVYMAAATPVRDFRLMALPLIECPKGGANPWCAQDPASPDYVNLRFYNLMLHPLADSHDMEKWGLVPEGSLLEWIDEMFGGAKSVDDRMFGKWTNAEKTMFMFPEPARERMTFRVFPAQARMRNGDAIEAQAFANECVLLTGPVAPASPPERCHPIIHGEFAAYSFWREAFLCGVDGCVDPDPQPTSRP